MSLLDHGIWWHVYPLGAMGAPRHALAGGTGHRLRSLDPWLDYVVELGCSGLLLGPIFASMSHGYDTLDHYRLDPRLGDDSDWEHFISETSRRGLVIMLDGVFNHVGIQHQLVQQDSPLIKRDATGPVTWEGYGDLIELDHSNPAVIDFVVGVMLHWLRRGIHGWRLDVAYAVPSKFWCDVLARVRQEFPHALFLGEVLHGDYPSIAAAGALDSVTQYELWKAIWSSLHDRNMWELAWALQRHDGFVQQMGVCGALPQTFVGNHDVNRIASLVGDAGSALAAIMLFTLPGMPSIYYGDEQSFRGIKGEGFEADLPIRPPLPDSPEQLSRVGEWLYRLYQDMISLRRRNPWLARGRVSVVDKDNAWLSYEVTGDGHRLRVDLRLEPHPQAVVTIDDVEQFRWR